MLSQGLRDRAGSKTIQRMLGLHNTVHLTGLPMEHMSGA